MSVELMALIAATIAGLVSLFILYKQFAKEGLFGLFLIVWVFLILAPTVITWIRFGGEL